MSGRAFETDKLIRFHHCDSAGIVFYPQYFVLFTELVEDCFNPLDTQRSIPFPDALRVSVARFAA